jgi:protein-S-isoprenylcysteine O-methyltransferase Ste14
VTRAHNYAILNNIPIIAIFVVLVVLVSHQIQGHPVFPNSWFPSQFAASAFIILLCIWIACELANNVLSKKNSITANQDRGSFRVVIVASWAAIFAIFIFRSLRIGIFEGSLRYIGFILFAAGIVLREWAIYLLGKHFTVRVQVREKARLVMQGPYRYIRHPSYTGTLLTMMGMALAVGTWFGAFLALALKLIAYRYRINVEEQALQKAFGPEWEDYKKRTWKLIPGF